MLDDEDDVVEGELDLFKEPDDFYQAERQHTTATHTTLQGQVLTLRLVGHNPLWVSVFYHPLHCVTKLQY